MKTKYNVKINENQIIIDINKENSGSVFNSLEEVEKYIEEQEQDNNFVFKKYHTVIVYGKIIIYSDYSLVRDARKGAGRTYYKSFTKLSEAIDFIRSYSSGPCALENFIKKEDAEYHELIESNIENGYLPIFTDGSYIENGSDSKVGYGYYAIKQNNTLNPEENEFFYGKGKVEGYDEFYQVPGEVYGIINSIEAAIEKGYSKIWIYSDLELAYDLYYGCKESNSRIGDDYKEKMKELKNREEIEDIKISWTQGHKGIFGNEAADFLAGKVTGKSYDGKKEYRDYFEKELI